MEQPTDLEIRGIESLSNKILTIPNPIKNHPIDVAFIGGVTSAHDEYRIEIMGMCCIKISKEVYTSRTNRKWITVECIDLLQRVSVHHGLYSLSHMRSKPNFISLLMRIIPKVYIKENQNWSLIQKNPK